MTRRRAEREPAPSSRGATPSAPGVRDADQTSGLAGEFAIERYKYILGQINAVNENVHRFLTLYQALTTAIVTAILGVFLGYRRWGIDAHVARVGIVGLLSLETVVAAFTTLLVLVGMLSWLDYRREETELANEIVHATFRRPPSLRNVFRWYETYIIGFIVAATTFMWIYAAVGLLSAIS